MKRLMKMGSDEYKCNNNNNPHQHQQQLYHHRYSFHQRTAAAAAATSTFLLPMLCRLSIKDVKVIKRSPASISKDDDPSSPKVSCIGGQVKRRKSRKIHVGFAFPTPTNNIFISSKKHTKLKRFFSGKNLNPAAAAAAGDGDQYSCRELLRRNNSTSERKSRKVVMMKNYNDVRVKVSELDPPLPVVKEKKRVKQPGGSGLWNRRRCAGGASLKTLQIQQIHLPNNQIIPPTPTTV